MTRSVQASTREQLSRPPLSEAEACTLVIFGATGDLTRRKLLPALYDLQCLGGMRSRCQIIGTGRTRLTDEQFRDRVGEAFAESKDAVDTNDPRWLEPVWNPSYIDDVEITAVETLGVERRAAFYEETGVPT